MFYLEQSYQIIEIKQTNPKSSSLENLWISLSSIIGAFNCYYVFRLNLAHTYCSKSIIETPEWCVNLFKVNNKLIDVALVSLLLTLNIFYAFFSSVSIVDLEQVNFCWVGFKFYGNWPQPHVRGVKKVFIKSTGKHLYRSFFFNEVANWRLAILFKKKLQHGCFLVNFTNFLTEHSQNTSGWLLLYMQLFKNYLQTCLSPFFSILCNNNYS